MDIERLLDATVKHDASDLHLRVGAPPKLRLQGKLRGLGNQILTPEDTLSAAKSITSDAHMQELDEVGTTDFGLSFRDLARFRVCVFRHEGHTGVVMRQIPNKMMSFDEIGLPPVVAELCMRPRGLFLVTGPTGCGKTTTLATMIGYINEHRTDHIITIEDPIEYVHEHKRCIITQRELGQDTPSFAEATRRGLRMDPDIMMVGEMRDLATMEAAITAAETGHLVFATLHTTGSARTINRIVDAFPVAQQEQVRTQLAGGLIAVLSQLLVLGTDGKRVAAFELMVSNPAVEHLIRKNETFKINSVIQTGAEEGMILLDDNLFNLYASGRVSHNEVLSRAYAPAALDEKIRQYRLELEKQKKR